MTLGGPGVRLRPPLLEDAPGLLGAPPVAWANLPCLRTHRTLPHLVYTIRGSAHPPTG